MSSNLAKTNRDWDASPKGHGDDVNIHHRDVTRKNNNRDDAFYALYTSFSPKRTDLREYVGKHVYSLMSEYIYKFTDKANPFYATDGHSEPNIAAVMEHRVGETASLLRERGFTVEIRDDTSQFGFIPRPTIGEIIVTGRDTDAADA